ncbi:MAG: helix-turn-helix domain-containing protein [Henriciella sp.]
MLFLDTILRFPAATLLIAIAVLVVRDARHLVQGRIAVVLCLTLAAMLITTAPDALLPPGPLYFALRVFDTANIVFLWWFGLSLFEDDFRLKRLHWGGLGIYLVCGLPARINYLLGYDPLWIGFDVTVRLVSIAMILHLFWMAMSGWRDDLIEARRRMRLWYTIATAIAAALIISSEVAYSLQTGDRGDPAWLSTSRVAIAFPAIVFGAWWFLSFRAEFLVFESVKPAVPRTPQINPKDSATYARLIEAMINEKLYRQQGLGIGELAEKINVPEHQLRALINQGLGYRNFSTFLNQYRIAEAKTALADPEQARIPILTIAMDAGYASLATFNRAFKASENETPSEFRAKALLAALQS